MWVAAPFGVLFVSLMLALACVVLLNRPRFLVAPAHRQDRGLLAALRASRGAGRMPADWKFAVEEVTAGVYRATARSAAGQIVERTGTDPDALRARVVADVVALSAG